jgi:hypothetical protein
MRRKQEPIPMPPLRPSLRYLKCKDPSKLQQTETFLRMFLDKRTRMIKLDNVLGTMLGLGLQHEHDVVKEYFEHFPFRVEGHLSEEEYIRVIERLEYTDIGPNSTKEDQQNMFNFFERGVGDGLITPEKVIEAAAGVGLTLD